MKCKFEEGEKVLCFHGPLISEAKCLKSSVTKEKQIKYLIHYAGWNKNWDEWVPESQLLKYNEANIQKQKEVQRAHAAQQSTQKRKKGVTVAKGTLGRKSEGGKEKESDSRSSTPVPGGDKLGGRGNKNGEGSVTPSSMHDSSSDAPTKKRSRLDPSVETEEQFLSKAEIEVEMPDELKALLLDDWDTIIKRN